MNHPTASLLCDRCGRSIDDRPEGGFRYCPGCALYVCDRCWSTVASRCQACARPDLAPSDLPTSRSIRDTIAPPLVPSPRLTKPQPVRLRQRTAAPVRRAPASRPRWRLPEFTPATSATSLARSIGSRLLIATSLALAVMAVGWAIDLSLDEGVAPPAATRTMEGTLSGTPPATASAGSAATPAPSVSASVTHTVAPGDTLTGLAVRYYGDESRWGEILRANAERIGNPENLRIGTELVIPSP